MSIISKFNIITDKSLGKCLYVQPYAPVVARACLLLECAHFVHLCNKGQWPTWMKMNFPMFRPSVPINNRNTSTVLTRDHVLQRTAGKLFYQWAEVLANINSISRSAIYKQMHLRICICQAIGSRLEELMLEDKQNVEHLITLVSDESKQRDLTIEDEEEDFLDEGCDMIEP